MGDVKRFSAPAAPARSRGVLPAQLLVPEFGRGLVGRPLLVERLVGSGAAVVVVAAPAGYGKTTLLAEWAGRDERCFAWLTASESQSDPVRLVGDVARALDSVDGLAAGEWELLAGGDLEGELLPGLAAVMLGRRRPFVLVVDDAHHLGGEGAGRVLSVLVDHVPDGSQLVLSSRVEPALGLGRLQAHRRLVRVGVAELTLGVEEGVELLEGAGVRVRRSTAAALVARTEGWPAALYLAAVAARSQGSAEQAAQRFGGGDRVVAGYLGEILGGLDGEAVEFLVQTCILERFSAGLCDAVRGRRDSAAVLEGLRGGGLLVVPLDRTGDWYRCHRLFRDLLRAQLRQRFSEEEPVLHRRASRWWEAHGDLDAAVRHAYAAGDVDRFAGLVWSAAPTYLTSSRVPELAAWMDLPSRQQIAASAPLTLTAAWLHLTNKTNLDQLSATLPPQAGSALPDGMPVEAAVALLRASKPAAGVDRMIGDAGVACRLLPEDSPWQAIALCALGTALRHGRDYATGRVVIEDCYTRALAAAPTVGVLCLTQLAWLAVGANDWHEAESDVRRARALLERAGMTSTWVACGVFATSALLSARFGDAGTAADHVRHALRSGQADEGLAPVLAVEARIVLARAMLLMGEVTAARGQVRAAASLAGQLPGLETLRRRIAEAKSAIEVAAMAESASAPLTPAEARVLTYLPTHLSFQAIGRDLTVSANTVKTHAVALYRKLGVSSRADAVSTAREQGLLPVRSDGPNTDADGRVDP